MIKLYEHPPTRSARCRWTLLEAGVDYESVNAIETSPDALGDVHPMRKIPAARFDDGPLFESAAISTYIADLHPDAGLGFPSGTWERAQHDQWVCFCLTEIESPLWDLTTRMIRAAKSGEPPREPSRHADVNVEELLRAATVLEAHLKDNDWLVGGRFSVTDIIASYSINMAALAGLLSDFPAVMAYRDRLLSRKHCTLMTRPPG